MIRRDWTRAFRYDGERLTECPNTGPRHPVRILGEESADSQSRAFTEVALIGWPLSDGSIVGSAWLYLPEGEQPSQRHLNDVKGALDQPQPFE